MTTFTIQYTNLLVTFFEILVVSFTLSCCLVFFKRKLIICAVTGNICIKSIVQNRRARSDTDNKNNFFYPK